MAHQHSFWLDEHNILSIAAIACAGVAAIILLVFLIRRPELGARTKVWLLFGLGFLPIASATAANVQGYKATQHRQFCASCHVMGPHAQDSEDPKSNSLAAIHARNPFFGGDNCYTCHADYGLFGTVLTKLGGMRHVWLYATQFRNKSLEEAKKEIHLIKPYPNVNCMQCHTTTAPRWLAIKDHKSARDAVVAGAIGCSSKGCHGVAHPTTKDPETLKNMMEKPPAATSAAPAESSSAKPVEPAKEAP